MADVIIKFTSNSQQASRTKEKGHVQKNSAAGLFMFKVMNCQSPLCIRKSSQDSTFIVLFPQSREVIRSLKNEKGPTQQVALLIILITY